MKMKKEEILLKMSNFSNGKRLREQEYDEK